MRPAWTRGLVPAEPCMKASRRTGWICGGADAVVRVGLGDARVGAALAAGRRVVVGVVAAHHARVEALLLLVDHPRLDELLGGGVAVGVEEERGDALEALDPADGGDRLLDPAVAAEVGDAVLPLVVLAGGVVARQRLAGARIGDRGRIPRAAHLRAAIRLAGVRVGAGVGIGVGGVAAEGQEEAQREPEGVHLVRGHLAYVVKPRARDEDLSEADGRRDPEPPPRPVDRGAVEAIRSVENVFKDQAQAQAGAQP